MVELPLEAKSLAAEIIRGGGKIWLDSFLCFGLDPSRHRLAYPVAVIVLSHHWPTILPTHRLKVNDPAKRIPLLEMQEPPLAEGSIDNRTLVGAIDVSGAGLKNDLPLIRSVDVLGAKNGLPTTPDTALRDAQVVISIKFMDLGSFRGRSLIHSDSIVQKLFTVRGHLVDYDRAGPSEAMAEICRAILVPERTGIFPCGDRLYAMQR